MDKLGSRCFDIEKGMDSMKEEIDAVKKENADLREQLRQQEQRVTKVLNDQNDLEQYDRRWNLRLFNVQEKTGETADDCARTCYQIVTEGPGFRSRRRIWKQHIGMDRWWQAESGPSLCDSSRENFGTRCSQTGRN